MVSAYGRNVVTDVDVSTIAGSSNNNQRFTVFDKMPEHGWGYEFRMLAGRTTGVSPTGRMALATVDANGNPDDRMAYSNTITFSSTMSNGTNGTQFTASIAFTDHPTYGYNSNGVQLWAGKQYGVGFSITGAALMHGMILDTNVNNKYSNTKLYLKDTASVTPSDPIASTSSGNGDMSVCIMYQANRPPASPSLSAPIGAITTISPNFNSSFSDPDSGYGDTISAYQIQVRKVGTTALLWNTVFTAMPSEQSSFTMTQGYGGTALLGATAYEWQERTADLFNTWSPWSGWVTFTTPTAGYVQPSTPFGKQLTLTPGPFVAVWSHATPLSTNAVQIKLLSAGGSVIGISPIITTVVANGGIISQTWAAAAFGVTLSKGGSYNWQMMGRDSNNVWSPWSALVAFNVDAPPNKPIPLTPLAGDSVSAPPKLRAKIVDPDNPMPGGGVVATARLKDAGGSILSSPAMSLVAGTIDTYETAALAFGTKEVQRITKGGTITGGTFTITVPVNALGGPATTAAINWNDSASVIQTRLEALANVGVGNVIVSGGPINAANVDLTFNGALQGYDLTQITVTNSLTGTGPTITPSTITNGAANSIPRPGTYSWDCNATDGTFAGDFSTQVSFTYIDGVTVVITLPPAGVIATNAPTFTWTSTTAPTQSNVFIYPTGQLFATGTPYYTGQIPGATLTHTVTAGILKNGVTYDAYVLVSALFNTWVSAPVIFTVTYTTPLWANANFLATPIALGSDGTASAILLSWGAAQEVAKLFKSYTIKRRLSGTLSGDVSEVTIAVITSQNQETFVDAIPADNVSYDYSIIKTVYIDVANSDQVDSAELVATSSVSFDSIVICSVADPMTYRCMLRLMRSTKTAHMDDTTVFMPWGATQPYIQMGSADYEVISGVYQVITDRFGQALDIMTNLRNLNTRQKANGDVICYRDNRGRKMFCHMHLEENDTALGMYEATIVFTEVSYIEGV